MPSPQLGWKFIEQDVNLYSALLGFLAFSALQRRCNNSDPTCNWEPPRNDECVYGTHTTIDIKNTARPYYTIIA